MILRPVINEEGKKVYVEISFDDAIKYENKDELLFTDEDEEDEFEEYLEELEEDDDEDDENEDEEDYGNKSWMNRIIQMLPFMSSNDIEEIVDEIINGNSDYNDFDLTSVAPFLKRRKCNELFIKLCQSHDEKTINNVVSLAPFVSDEALSVFVDEYITGNYKDINVDALFPFMNSNDIKRLFKYEMSKKR